MRLTERENEILQTLVKSAIADKERFIKGYTEKIARVLEEAEYNEKDMRECTSFRDKQDAIDYAESLKGHVNRNESSLAELEKLLSKLQ